MMMEIGFLSATESLTTGRATTPLCDIIQFLPPGFFARLDAKPAIHRATVCGGAGREGRGLSPSRATRVAACISLFLSRRMLFAG